MCVQVHICAYVHVEPDDNLWYHFSDVIYLVFEQGLLLTLSSPNKLGWLVSEPQGSLSISPVLGLQARTPSQLFYMSSHDEVISS